MRRPARALALSLVLLLSTQLLLAAPSPRPRLAVIIVIDQLRADYLERFHDRFGSGGFQLLLERGARFTRCEYPYAAMVTAVGHATIGTGTYAPWHGIVGNAWYDRENKSPIAPVKDSAYRLVGAGELPRPGSSPARLLGSTLGDELRLATLGRAKVIAVSLKDYAAILASGKSANEVFWFDEDAGDFITSTYYMNQLPGWATDFNRQGSAERFYGRSWDSAAAPGQKPETLIQLTSKSGRPDREYYEKLAETPFMTEVLLNFAKAAVRSEQLGADDVPDLLIVSISSNDYIGHARGPYSREVEEMTAATDRLLADFFRFLDQQVGLNNIVLALTADHGIAPTLEQARERKLDAKNISSAAVTAAVNAAFEKRFGKGEWVEKMLAPDGAGVPDIYLNRTLLEQRRIPLAEAERLAGDAALSVEGVDGYFTGSELRSGSLPAGGLAMRYALSYHPGRSGDVALVLRPFWMMDVEPNRTKHGSPYRYSNHVPLIFLGSAFRAGQYATACSPADLAVTLAETLGLTSPSGAMGRVLTEALATPAPAAPPARRPRPGR